MSNITNTDAVVTESKLKDFYEDIKPFLGCPAYLTSEGTSDYYSTDEKVIGRWTDGKPLYQKTIYVASATKYLNIQDMSGKELKQLNGVFDNGSANEVLPYADNSGYVCLVHVLNNNLQVYLNTFSSVANLYVTIQYTKTTDSASTTIQEDPNEYSTTEKIIGKWIDGKPLYQKTCSKTVGASTTANFYPADAENLGSNVETFWHDRWISTDNNGSGYTPDPHYHVDGDIKASAEKKGRGNDTNPSYYELTNGTSSPQTFVCTFRYTKKTD